MGGGRYGALCRGPGDGEALSAHHLSSASPPPHTERDIQRPLRHVLPEKPLGGLRHLW